MKHKNYLQQNTVCLEQQTYANQEIFSQALVVMVETFRRSDPGKSWGCSTNSSVIHSFSNPFPPTALRRRYAQTLRDSSSSGKIVIKNFLNLEGHQICISGSEVTAILLKGWAWPIGGVASGTVCAYILRSRLVLKELT